MKYILSDANAVIEPILHDGLLKSIITTRNNTIKLEFELMNNKPVICELSDVLRLRVDNFSEGNIVLDVTITKIDNSLSNGDKEKVMTFYIMKNRDEVFIDTTILKLKEESYQLVSLNPSYGASMVCICKHISFKAGGMTLP